MNFYKSYNATQFDLAERGHTKDSIRAGYGALDFLYECYLPDNKNSAILDVGCGYGRLVLWLRDKGYENSSGVDLSDSQIEIGKNIGIPNLTLANAIEFIKNGKKKYDLILAIDLLEHLSETEAVELLNNCSEALKEGGKIVLQYPNPEGLHFNSIFYGDITHKTSYTHKGLYQLAACSNLRVNRMKPIRPMPLGIKGKIRAYLWRIKELQLAFWQAVERGYSSGLHTVNVIAVLEKIKH